MKIHKMVCLDYEIIEKLNGENVSALVNKLLIEHLEMRKPRTREELEKEIAKCNIQLEAEEKIKELENGNNSN